MPLRSDRGEVHRTWQPSPWQVPFPANLLTILYSSFLRQHLASGVFLNALILMVVAEVLKRPLGRVLDL